MDQNSSNIWHQYHDRLHRFILRRVNEPATAEDILQEVFLRIHKHRDELEKQSRLSAWIFSITRNAIIDHYRQQRPMETIPEDLQAPDNGEAVIRREISTCFEPMINALPEPYRQALIHTEVNGLRQTELAKSAGISVSGAKSRVQRGRSLLKTMLLDCCHFEFDRQGQMVDYGSKKDSCSPDCGSYR